MFRLWVLETTAFTYTRISLKQWEDFTIEMDQQAYVEKISRIQIKKDKRKSPTVSLRPSEALRSLVGALQYAAVHTQPDLSVRGGELQSGLAHGTVQLLIDENKLLDAKTHPLSIASVSTRPAVPGSLFC